MIDDTEPSDARNRFTWRTVGVCATLHLRRDPHPKALIAARMPTSSLAEGEHDRSVLVHLRIYQGRVRVLYAVSGIVSHNDIVLVCPSTSPRNT